MKRESAVIYSTKCHHVSTSIECLGPPSRNRRISERFCMTWTIASPFPNVVGYPLSTTASSPNLTLFFSNFGQLNWDSWTFGLLRGRASVLFDRDGTMCSTLRCSLLPYPPFECACLFYFLLHFLDDFLLDRNSMYIIFYPPYHTIHISSS